ncbi:MAG: polysaccharide deacetylase family protein [Acidiferrobacterales bacterium]
MNLRTAKVAVKRIAEFATAKTAPLLWHRRRGSLVVLMYHRVLPPGDPRLEVEQPGMYVHPATLHLHLRTLKRHFQPVRLDHWIRAARDNAPLPERAFAITFDDGWADNFEYAYPLLVAENVPATIFVVSDLVGTGRLFWPERLGTLLRQGLAQHAAKLYSLSEFAWLRTLDMPIPSSERELDPELLDRIVNGAKRDDDATLCARVEAMAARLGDSGSPRTAELLSWDQIREMAGSGLVSIGSHTRRHTRLSDALTPETLHDEIAGSRHIIESNAGCEAPLFCYPNGDATANVRSIVSEHYQAACSTLPGWHGVGADHYMIRRISVHQDITCDETSLLARLSGWI